VTIRIASPTMKIRALRDQVVRRKFAARVPGALEINKCKMRRLYPQARVLVAHGALDCARPDCAFSNFARARAVFVAGSFGANCSEVLNCNTTLFVPSSGGGTECADVAKLRVSLKTVANYFLAKL